MLKFVYKGNHAQILYIKGTMLKKLYITQTRPSINISETGRFYPWFPLYKKVQTKFLKRHGFTPGSVFYIKKCKKGPIPWFPLYKKVQTIFEAACRNIILWRRLYTAFSRLSSFYKRGARMWEISA